ncbi:tyrosine-protein phosphatase [Chelatococcus asaccharovorans]|uniref:tyrosine-protein phosphatase n=1 Tax=Chelatococcus asaccharovorans TaxID=28210 RepID=UPI00224C6DD5|nr:tyrosine-protein phosphatase [Chelatococcus asaccharovorans]CAH1660974.1 Protein-tyrosine-phosphatase [Chelatococcus asaccharovorans]CAH1690113.1 Protein-tyrosine-phosphatase [Chelatococcus asaccharovorans]
MGTALEKKSDEQVATGGPANLRDIGGWSAGGGRRVRSGQMFRSTALDHLDASGLKVVGGLGLRTVIDLRTAAERRASPDECPAGATWVACDVLGDVPGAVPARLSEVMAEPQKAVGLLGGGKAEAMLEHGYRQIVGLPSAIQAYRDFIVLLSSGDRRPLLFHCTTGKDRTGWAAAVVLTILGVSRDDVMRDYMLTNVELLPSLQPVVVEFSMAGGDPELLEAVLGVRNGYLDAAFDEASKCYGSMDGYLTIGLGINDRLRQRLRDDLTEEVT